MSVTIRSVGTRVAMALVTLAAQSALAAPPDPLADALARPLAASRAETAPSRAQEPGTALPPSLRAAYIQARQNEAGRAYQMTARGAQVAAHNAAHHLALQLDEQGMHLRGRDGKALGSLQLVRAGCADRPALLTKVPPQARGTRVEYPRAGLTEWYVNGPLGIEQGFTVARDPGCRRLAFELQLGPEWAATLVGSGPQARIELQDRRSGQRLYYSDLFARDARGRELGAQLQLLRPAAQTIRLEVDAAGARYPVEIDPLMWTQQPLPTSDGATGDVTGFSLSISGSTAVVAAPGKTVGTNFQQGQVYVFTRTGDTWTEQQKIPAAEPQYNGVFGYVVALSGDTLVITAPTQTVGDSVQQGRIYVYTRTGDTWTEQQRLTASDGGPGQQFGQLMALSGDTIVVGSPLKTVGTSSLQGQVYVFTRTGTTWAESQILTASDAAANDFFGSSVAVSGDTMVVGAAQKNMVQGQVYVFTRTNNVWSEQQIITAADGKSGDNLGARVAVSGDTLVASAPGATVGENDVQGKVYVFTRTGTTWTEQQQLAASDGMPSEGFGAALAVSGDNVVVGNYQKVVGTNALQGQAYLFTRTGTTWTEQQIVTPVDGAAGEYFGYAVALDGSTALVSSVLKKVGEVERQGLAYVIAPPRSENGVACAAGSDCQSGFCTDGVCCSTACGDGSKTDCQSCVAAESGGTDGTCAPIAARLQTVCRAAAGTCDGAEYCDGTSTACPSDALLPAGTVCLAAADASVRDAVCSGTSATCPDPLQNPSPDPDQPSSPAYRFSGGGLGGCAAAGPLGGAAAPGAAGAAGVITALLLFVSARRRVAR